MPRTFKPRNIPCPVKGCTRYSSNKGGITNHLRAKAPDTQQGIPDELDDDEDEDNDDDPFIDPPNYDFADDPSQYQHRRKDTDEDIHYHPTINGRPCDVQGEFLPPEAPPPPWEDRSPNNYSPFNSQESFLVADLLFRRTQMSASNIDDLMQFWARSLPPDCDPPYMNTTDLLETIDAANMGHLPWKSFSLSYQASDDEDLSTAVPWKIKDYDVWYRDPHEVLKTQLSNRSFAHRMDFSAKKIFSSKTNSRQYQDLMSGEWAWERSDNLAQDEQNHGATFCPIILGSDKTTVSVATGQNEYYPLYMSNGLFHNNVRRAHQGGVSLIAFLALPKTDREHDDSKEFRQFRRNLFHASLSHILQTLRAGMSEPVVIRYADGYYRRTIFGLGPYIADYPEQVLLGCVVQDWCPRCTALKNDIDGKGGRRTHELTRALIEALDEKTLWFDYGIVSGIMPFTSNFPCADIHELITPDILHQLVKGTFKDHLVTWVESYIKSANTRPQAKKILADIDRRMAAVPLFPGLRRFPQGRGFKQWTGNDSKALMKVFLPAIIGHVPPAMVRAIATFLEFCYLVRWSVITTDDLEKLQELLTRFHKEREIFRAEGVRPDGFNLPRQHSLKHYCNSIRKFGAPNGLCSSITESRHITAVKKPWRRSSRFNALGQMLLTNQRLDKLAACAIDFRARGMLNSSIWAGQVTPPSEQPKATKEEEEEDDDGGPVDNEDIIGEVKLAQRSIPGIPRKLLPLAVHLNIPSLPSMLSRFLYSQENPELDVPLNDIPLEQCPKFTGNVYVYPSAIATYCAPSDLSGVSGMFRERIRSTHSWRSGPERRDCVFVEHGHISVSHPCKTGSTDMYKCT
ncbi:hypothetical protein JOM56_002951 [Amanita muscaria]